MCDSSDEDARTLFCANLSDQITEALLYELFLQAGPLHKISIPKDQSGRPRSFGFVTYTHSISVPYAISLFAGTKLFNRELRIKERNPTNKPVQLPPQPPPQQIVTSPQYNNPKNPFNRKSSALRCGPQAPITSNANMEPTSSKRTPKENLLNKQMMDINLLFKMGNQMFQEHNNPANQQSNQDSKNESSKSSSTYKYLHRHENRSHHQDNRSHHQDNHYPRQKSSSWYNNYDEERHGNNRKRNRKR